MKVGSLVRPVRPPKNLHASPAVFRTDVSCSVEVGDVCVVLAFQEYMSDATFFACLLCPGGVGWIGSSYLEEVE